MGEQAIILAGGKGARLRPYTTVLPKPLMPIGNYPILEVVIRQLRRAGFTEILLAVGHLGELIEAYLGDGSKWGVKVVYSREEQPLGTAGPIARFAGLHDDFLVMNGDILTDLDYATFFQRHRDSGALATVSTYEKKVKIDLGIVAAESDGRISGYTEKPTLSYRVSMGIYAFRREVLRYLEPQKYLDFPDLVLRLIGAGERVQSADFGGFWLDIGRREDYEAAAENFERLEERFLKGAG